MNKYGKILFYNEQNGNGIAITKENEKIKFNIEEWDNYDVMPKLGLEISFILEDGIAKKIDIFKHDNIEKIIPEKVEKNSTTTKNKCKNKELEKIGDELNSLLDNSNDNLNSLDKKISLSMNINATMDDYFNHLKKELHKREGYKKVNGRLNYSFAKRFLWTTFNNLVDIDNNIVTLRISSISDDLKFVSNLKDNFDRKIQYPLTAFQDIFLSSQKEYISIKKMTTETIERLNLLRTKEETINFEKDKKKQEILKSKTNEEKIKLTRELKILNGTYVDIVHMMARLQEIHKINSKRLSNFESSHKENFYKSFKTEAKKHQKNITNILNAQTYLLDFTLWKEAKSSHAILNYFKSLSVDIELNTKTYLKYYLSTLDETKANKDTKDLFTFYNYLTEMQKDYILIVTASSEDALDYSQYIQSIDKTLVVKSFISELESIKWAMLNTIKVIVLESRLLSTNAKEYLDYYHNNIFSKPKIILIGDDINIKSNNYIITEILPKYTQAPKLIKSLNKVLNTKTS